MCTLGFVSLISLLRSCDSNTDIYVMWTLGSVSLMSLLRICDSNTDTSVRNVHTWHCLFDVLIEEL